MSFKQEGLSSTEVPPQDSQSEASIELRPDKVNEVMVKRIVDMVPHLSPEYPITVATDGQGKLVDGDGGEHEALDLAWEDQVRREGPGIVKQLVQEGTIPAEQEELYAMYMANITTAEMSDLH